MDGEPRERSDMDEELDVLLAESPMKGWRSWRIWRLEPVD